MKHRNFSREAEPVSFKGLFGWLHMPPGEQASGCGVVLCNPYGAAAVGTHRNWRHFAEMLAAAGFPTLRFDYPSTGDSADVPENELLAGWLRSITEAAGWLRATAGLQELAICGLRFGALLGAAAARAAQADHLALLAPVANGRLYVRELAITGQTHGIVQPQDGGLEAEGLYLTREQAAQLRALDLKSCLQAAAPRQILVLETPRQLGLGHSLADALTGSSTVSVADFADCEAFFGTAASAPLPREAFGAVVDWLGRVAVRTPQTMPDIAPVPSRLVLPGTITSSAFRFGADRGLFCIATAPFRPLYGAPALLLLNTGAEPHTGHSRFSVLLSRHLAANGRTAFSIDVTGFGDSTRPTLEGSDNTALTPYQRGLLRVFRPELVGDVIEALDEIERQGFARCVVAGICSGANLAMLAALKDARITGLILINPTFTDRTALPFVPAAQPPVGLRGLVRRGLDGAGFDRRLRNQIRDLWHFGRRRSGARLARMLRNPVFLDRRARWLWVLRARQTTILTIANEGDDSIRDWHRYADGLGLAPPVVLAGPSHTFEPVAMRDTLIKLIGDHFMSAW